MSKILIYINIIATLLLLFTGFDQILAWKILTPNGVVFVIFISAIFLLTTTFLQITKKEN